MFVATAPTQEELDRYVAAANPTSVSLTMVVREDENRGPEAEMTLLMCRWSVLPDDQDRIRMTGFVSYVSILASPWLMDHWFNPHTRGRDIFVATFVPGKPGGVFDYDGLSTAVPYSGC